jgi:NADPH:quinone reductase-like Zn-dependent oxidoreductase
MKAAVYTRYGPPDVLQIWDVEKPVPNDNEVLIRVRAASVNPFDWHLMEGKPPFARLFGLGQTKGHTARP